MFKFLISFKLSLFFAALTLSVFAQDDQQCLALVLQGGGDKGAYQAGVLSALVNQAPAGTAQYDVVSGVSIGAVNAALISQFPKGQEVDMANQLLKFWQNIKASDVYKQWFGGIVQGLLFEPSLYDTTPGVKFMKAQITKSPQRYVSVGATDVDKALYKSFNNFNEDINPEDFVQQVFASVALPALFPYVVINNTAYFDGGAVMSVDVASAVSKCRQITGGNDPNIIIDIVLLTASRFKAADASDYNGIKMLIRMLELMAFHSAMNGLVQAQNTYPNVTFRYLIQPSKSLPDSALPIGFNHNQIMNMIAQGEQDALAAIQAGPGVTFKDYLHEAQLQLRRGDFQQIDNVSMEKYMSELDHFVKDQLKNQEYESRTVTI